MKESYEKPPSELHLARNKVEAIADRLGKPIDLEIKEPLIAVVASGFNTTGSCEGHIKWGLPVPYIEIKAPNKPLWTMKGQEEFFKKIAEDNNLTIHEVYGGFSDDDAKDEKAIEISKLAWGKLDDSSTTEEYNKWREEDEAVEKSINQLLKEFNTSRKVEEDVKLVFDGGRITNNSSLLKKREEELYRKGSELSEGDWDKAEKMLPVYREEMNNFANFLKKKLTE